MIYIKQIFSCELDNGLHGGSVNMLSTRVKTTRDLMSIALQAEREAIRRYSQLAANMREAGNDSAAALFERMVNEEQGHERLLLAWMEKESVAPNPDIGPIRWRDPQVSTTYNDEARDPLYSTPYKALAFAVNNEENAFRFYTHVASRKRMTRRYANTLKFWHGRNSDTPHCSGPSDVSRFTPNVTPARRLARLTPGPFRLKPSYWRPRSRSIVTLTMR